MIKYEIKKIIKMKIYIFPLLFIVGYLFYLMVNNGEFGYDYADNPFIMYYDKGKEYYGQDAYEKNKRIAIRNRGEISDELINEIHIKYSNQKNEDFNTTYAFFENVFKISQSDFLMKNDIWEDKTIFYGFTGDWEAYNLILKSFFSVYAFGVVIFAAPLFSYEKENKMTQLICISKKGGEQFLYNKIKAIAIVLNIFLIIVLILISLIHFMQYGFSDWNVSLQCSVRGEFVNTNVTCNMAQYALFQIFYGFIGCNMLLVITSLISIVCDDSFSSLITAIIGNWGLSYPVIHFAIQNDWVDIILSILPVNMLSVSSMIKVIPSWKHMYCIMGIQFCVFVFLILLLDKTWKTKKYYKELF